MLTHPVLIDLRAMTRALIPRLKEAGTNLDLIDEAEPLSGDAFDVLFVRLLRRRIRGRNAAGPIGVQEAVFELRVFYDPTARNEGASSQALSDAEALLLGLSDAMLLPPGSVIQDVRALSAQIERRSSELWVLHVDVEASWLA